MLKRMRLRFEAAPLLVSMLVAQGPPTDPEALARDADARAIVALHAAADALAAQKQFGQAVALRQRILEQYGGNDEKALTQLGYVKVGDLWHRDADKVIQDRDLKGEPKALKKVEADWAKAQQELVKAHRRAAEALAAAAKPELARLQWQRLLLYAPGDPKATASLQLEGFEGFKGSAAELHLLRRSRTIRLALDYLKRKAIATEPTKSKTLELLEGAKLAHRGVASAHFQVWGTMQEKDLVLAAQFAERSLLLARTLFGTASGSIFVPATLRDIIMVSDRGAYGQVLDACASQFDAERLKFLKESVEISYVKAGERELRLYLINAGVPLLQDQAVRGVMQDATGLHTHGLWEGIGHAACCLFFDRTLSFLIEQQKERTVTAYKPRPLVPDLGVWREIASESSLTKSDTATSQLVLLHAAKFSSEERVKAWAMCDYILRWRPELIAELDASRTDAIHDPDAIANEFKRRTRVDLAQVDGEWRDLWARGKALREAMVAEPMGSKEEVVAARAVCDAINDARTAADVGPLGFYVSHSVDALTAVRWYEDVAKAEKEAQREPGKPAPASLPMPPPPPALGHSLLGWRGQDPATAVAVWMLQPGTRDTLLHAGRGLIGIAKGKQGIVLDLAEPALPARTGLPFVYPRAGQAGIAAAGKVSQLGDRLAAKLGKAGKKPDDWIGFPLSLHFLRMLTPDEVEAVSCQVSADGIEVDGVLECAQGEPATQDQAPGCFVFVPLQSLPAGKTIRVEWTVPKDLLPKGERFPGVEIRVK
jgi:hypothetical protein